ncbi:hypothetical protein [Methanosarcina mazei]|nr:hypothetical protein [Methanosarcina mazei]
MFENILYDGDTNILLNSKPLGVLNILSSLNPNEIILANESKVPDT